MGILLVGLVPLAGLVYALWRVPDATGATLPFGVRATARQAGHPAIARAKRDFRLLLVAAAAAALTVLALLRAEAALWGPIAAFGVFVVLAHGDYYLAHRRLRAVKLREGWYVGQREALAADTALRAAPTRFPLALAAVCAGLVAATAAVGAAVRPHLAATGPAGPLFPVLPQACLTALLIAAAWLVVHARQELDPADPGGSAARDAAFRAAMARIVLVLALGLDATLLLRGLRAWGLLPGGLPAAALAIPNLAGFTYVVVAALNLGQGGNRIPVRAGAPTGLVHRDDDRFWIGGLLYFNRADPAVFVQRRFGVGWTPNVANPFSWLALAAAAGLVVLLRLAAGR